MDIPAPDANVDGVVETTAISGPAGNCLVGGIPMRRDNLSFSLSIWAKHVELSSRQSFWIVDKYFNEVFHDLAKCIRIPEPSGSGGIA